MDKNKPIAWQEPTFEYVAGDADFMAAGSTDINGETGEIAIRMQRPTTRKLKAIRTHELLHAKYQRYPTLAADDARQDWMDAHSIANDTQNSIEDATNHLLHWPVGEDLEADAGAMEQVWSELDGTLQHIKTPTDWANVPSIMQRMALSIALRSIATVRVLGDVADALRLSVGLTKLFGASVVQQLNAITDLVAKDDVHAALLAMHKIMPVMRSEEAFTPDMWTRVGFRGAQLREMIEHMKRAIASPLDRLAFTALAKEAGY